MGRKWNLHSGELFGMSMKEAATFQGTHCRLAGERPALKSIQGRPYGERDALGPTITASARGRNARDDAVTTTAEPGRSASVQNNLYRRVGERPALGKDADVGFLHRPAKAAWFTTVGSTPTLSVRKVGNCWFVAPVLKTGPCHSGEGSIPSPSFASPASNGGVNGRHPFSCLPEQGQSSVVA